MNRLTVSTGKRSVLLYTDERMITMANFTDFLKGLFGQSPKAAAENPTPSPKIPQAPKKNEKQHVEIRSAEDAKALFLSLDYANDITIERNFDAETVAAFKAHANSDLMRQWTAEKCEEQLKTIAGGDTENYHEILKLLLSNAEYWGMYIIDRDLLLQAWEILWKKEKPTAWLVSQMKLYLKKADPEDDSIFLWMERALSYLQENFPDDYEKARYGDFLYEFKEEVTELRGRRLENGEINCGGFRFTAMPDKVLDTIFEHYNKQYNGDPAALRESLCDLNCTYGVEDDTLLLTSDSQPVDSYYHRSWDHYHFMIVLHGTESVYRVECKRDIADGRFRVYTCPEELLPYADAISDAVTCYRNRPAKNAFEKAMEQERPGFRLVNAMHDDRKRLMERIPSCFGYLKERLTGNPLAEILEALIAVCEEHAPEYGIHNTTFGEPATEEEFAQWEKSHGCKLPEDLKDFLRFANGAELPCCSANIFSLDRFGLYDDCMEEGYVSIGDAIGDGTTLCFRKADGEICVEDHGEISECGMDGLLEWILDFAE